jgi:hypothetical protein
MAHKWCHNDAMDLGPYVENILQQLADAAEAGSDDARAIAERLVAPLDAAMRLTLQDVLAAAAEEITTELAPGSVELRLRGRDLELVVTPSPAHSPGGDLHDRSDDETSNLWPATASGGALPASVAGDEAAMSRINLRMPDRLKARIEQAANGEGLSVNAWLLRAAAAALERTRPDHRRQQAPLGAQRYTGWAR